ncbi:LytR/AlgR family response regulator transcription factor [Fulvivirga lutimaris]|uniref:LytR/AlgR family response regulator transcription factor n=1 Tax=Fulvivirga lutimaris TaxID=1819566 RepID=UPI0012BBF830|nr:LytTR family DNA-binding domain-containing protein [Fulvivirga lutimaris]MTI40019.1 response regulator transcription factor [Fulvivirga lutimaris]
MKMKCIIVDDEPLAIEIIESYIDRLDDLEIVATCTNALKAFEILQKEPVDLMFLDIEMPKLTGIDFIKTLKNPPKIILTTAYRDYALESYELDVVDYLLKPISFDRFLIALQKAYKTDKSEPANGLTSTTEGEYIYLKADKKMVKVMLNDIHYIESLKDYIRVKTADKDVITHQKISYLEEKLPDDSFIRIHRSFIVPLKKIESYSSSTIEVPGKELPIGRLYKNKVLDTLNAQNQLD